MAATTGMIFGFLFLLPFVGALESSTGSTVSNEESSCHQQEWR